MEKGTSRGVAEKRRLQALRDFGILDTPPEPSLDEITRFVAHFCRAPIALISLVDEKRQWFKSRVGWEGTETPREIGFCTHAIRQPGLFLVPDAEADARFCNSPLVVGGPGIRFYAGAPLITPDGFALGTLCVMDRVARNLDSVQREALEVLGRQVVVQLELRRLVRQLAEREERFRTTLRSIGDAVISTDAEGRVTLLNPVAERLTGWSEAEAVGQPVTDVFRIRNEETGEPARNPVERVLQEGTVIGLANHTLLISRDGREIPIADAGAPILDDQHRITGVVVVFRDQTEERRAQRAVAEARAFAESIVATVREPLLVLDAALRVVSANRSFYQTFQVTEGETLGRLLYELGNRQWDIPRLRALLEDILPNNTQFSDYEVTHEFERIGRRTMLLNARRLRREGGRTQLILLAIEDITERQRAAEALRELQERDRNVFELISDYAYTFRVEPDGTLRGEWVNDAFVRVFGFTIPEIDARGGWQSMVHPEDLPRMIAHAHRVLSGQRDVCEVRFLTRDGQVRWLRDHAVPVIDKALGRVARLHGAAQDITERKQMEETLRANERRFRLLIENAPDMIHVVNNAGILRFRSPSASKILGYSNSERLGQSVLETTHPDDVEKAAAALRAAVQRCGEPIRFECRVRHKDGSWRLLSVVAQCVPGEDPEGFIVLNSRDVTEVRQLEAQLRQAQKLEAVGQLAGGVAHDFNNILAVVMMQSGLLLALEGLPAEVREGLHQIHGAAERAANLTRQLLLFSRRQVMQPRLLDLNNQVKELVKMLRRIIGEDISLELNLSSQPLWTHADAGMLDQVVMNLVVNARDAMPRGGRLTIETGDHLLTEAEAARIGDVAPGRFVALRIKDTGCGIVPEHLPRIFEPFFTTKEPGKGTGLGLATVFGIVKQHRGWVSVESELNKGSTFCVFLPWHEVQGESSQSADSSSLPRGSETILLVEDDAAVRALTRTVLEANGYRVLEAASGVEALELWSRHGAAVHLVLTDLVMPGGMSGWELAARLRGTQPRLRVIFTSGYSSEFAGRKLILASGERFLAKPATPQQLLEMVRRCLDA